MPPTPSPCPRSGLPQAEQLNHSFGMCPRVEISCHLEFDMELSSNGRKKPGNVDKLENGKLTRGAFPFVQSTLEPEVAQAGAVCAGLDATRDQLRLVHRGSLSTQDKFRMSVAIGPVSFVNADTADGACQTWRYQASELSISSSGLQQHKKWQNDIRKNRTRFRKASIIASSTQRSFGGFGKHHAHAAMVPEQAPDLEMAGEH